MTINICHLVGIGKFFSIYIYLFIVFFTKYICFILIIIVNNNSEKAVLRNASTGVEYFFPCDQWFDRSEGKYFQ